MFLVSYTFSQKSVFEINAAVIEFTDILTPCLTDCRKCIEIKIIRDLCDLCDLGALEEYFIALIQDLLTHIQRICSQSK